MTTDSTAGYSINVCFFKKQNKPNRSPSPLATRPSGILQQKFGSKQFLPSLEEKNILGAGFLYHQLRIVCEKIE